MHILIVAPQPQHVMFQVTALNQGCTVQCNNKMMTCVLLPTWTVSFVALFSLVEDNKYRL